MKVLLDLFRTFFVIGGFTFGGGHAMLQLIRDAIVDRKGWLDDEEFLDLFAVAQSLPGVFAVNMSIFIGYRIARWRGAVVSALGTILPSALVILFIAMHFTQIQDNPHIERLFKGLRPAVVALIAAPVVSTWRTMRYGWKWVWIPVLCALSVWWWGLSPLLVIFLSALLGWLYATFLVQKPASADSSEETSNESERK